jgi:hypothetical protein
MRCWLVPVGLALILCTASLQAQERPRRGKIKKIDLEPRRPAWEARRFLQNPRKAATCSVQGSHILPQNARIPRQIPCQVAGGMSGHETSER